LSGGLINYPNPFTRETIFYIEKLAQSDFTLDIYNFSGQKVREFNGVPNSSGNSIIKWDGKDNNGSSVPTGLYFCRFASNGTEGTIKVLKVGE